MFKRILMNAADASPGNGAPAGAPPDVPASTPAPQAQGAPAATEPPVDLKQLMSTVGELAKSVNSLHAAERRAREGKQPASDDKPKTPATTEDVLAIRDAFDDATSELRLTKDQRSLLREHVMSRRPSSVDVDSVVSDYVRRAGWSAPAATPAAPAQQGAAQPAAPAQPSNAIPASSRGAPPAPQIPLEEMNPWTMSEADRDAFIKSKGIKVYLEKARQFGKGIRIDPRK